MSIQIRLLASSALAAVLLAGQAAAQTAPQAVEGEGEVDQIVVTGYRASTQATIVAKRSSPEVLDSISQDDIAQLPDLNIVEAVRRVPGISVAAGADSTKNRDLYQRATIRGLDPRYNLTTVDGVQIASADQTFRGARLDLLPSTMVSQVQVIKTITAGYDPHALGGQVNLVSKSAFAIGRSRYLTGEAFVGNNSTAGDLVSNDKVSARANLTAAMLFGAEQQFGLVISAEYQRLPSSSNAEIYGTDGSFWSYFTAQGTRTPFASQSPTGFLAPISAQGYRFENMRQRASFSSKLEWRPSERAKLELSAGYYFLQDDETRFEFLTRPNTSGAGGTPDNAGAVPAAPVVPTSSSGRFSLGDIQQGISFQPTKRGTYLVSLHGDFELAPKLRLEGWASDSKATYREQWKMVKYDTSPRPGVASSNLFVPQSGYSYVIVDSRPRLTFNNPAIVNDPANYLNMYWRDIDRNLDQRVSFGKLNLDYNRAPGGRGLGGTVGVAVTRTTQSWDIIFDEKVPATAAAQQVIGTLADVVLPQRMSNYATPGTPYFFVDLDKAWAKFQTMPGQFVNSDQTANNFQDDYTDRETTKAAFVEVGWRGERLNLLAGLRRDDTDVNVRAFSVPTETGVTGYVPTSRHGGYAFWLPSVLASFDLTPRFRLKASANKTIGRPDFSQYAARTTYTIGSDGSLTVNTGNPDLKPREAWNFDLSAEWYFARNSLFSVALFDKELKNEIFTASRAGAPTAYRGRTYDVVRVSAPLNSAGGSVKGVEFNLIQDQIPFAPDLLKGLGLAANLTLLDGGFDLAASTAGIAAGTAPVRRTSGLIQQPNYIANLTVFYARGGFQAHVSYNRVGDALQSVDQDAPWRDIYQKSRQQVDLQARYRVREGLDLVAEAQNLTAEPFVVKQGLNKELLNNYFNVGRTLWLGVSWHPGAGR